MDEFGQPTYAAAPEASPSVEQSLESIDTSSGSIKAGETIATYSVLESAPYARTRKWAFGMLLGVLVILAIGFGLDGMNSIPMAIAFIVLIGVYTMTVKRSDPDRKVPLVFTQYGMQLAGQFYPYAKMRFFYLVELPTYTVVTIVREGRFVVGTELYLNPTDPVQEIREILQENVPEDLSAKETAVQRLIRLLQL